MDKQFELDDTQIGNKTINVSLSCDVFKTSRKELHDHEMLLSALLLKGALDNISKISFWLNFIYHVNIDC